MKQWFLKWGPHTSSISIIRELLDMQILGQHPSPAESESLGLRPAI